MRIVVTGAASPLGRAVVDRLVRAGHEVVGVVRRVAGIEQMRRLGATPFRGDVCRVDQVAKAVVGAEQVIHLAGFFDFWDPAESGDTYETVNVGATRNVLAAALVANVRRVVVGSSAVTVDGGDAERFGGRRSRPHGSTAFERSKREAEKVALRVRRRGVEVVLVNPAIVVAPGDPGWTGRLLTRAVAGRRPYSSEAPLGWVWVDDAAAGIVRAAGVGVDGQRYVLSGETLSSRAFLSRVASSVGAPPPRAMPDRLTMMEGALATTLARVGRRRPRLALDEARFLTSGFQADGAAARDALGLEYTPSSRYIPAVARDYARALERFARPA